MRFSRRLAAAAMTISMLALGAPAAAHAMPYDATSAGTVTLYGPSPTTPVWRTTYTSCPGQVALVRHEVRTFDNRPLAGCQVVLVADQQTFELCVGRGEVPAAFQTPRLVRIEPGWSPSCPVVRPPSSSAA